MPRDHNIPGTPADWLSRAKSDMALARAPLPEGAVYESLCFHAQQAAEKAVKAVYKAKGRGFEYTHNIGHLLYGLEREGISVPQTVWDAADLTRFAWEARYPGVVEPVTQAEYREAVAQAVRVVEWAGEFVEGKTP